MLLSFKLELCCRFDLISFLPYHSVFTGFHGPLSSNVDEWLLHFYLGWVGVLNIQTRFQKSWDTVQIVNKKGMQ